MSQVIFIMNKTLQYEKSVRVHLFTKAMDQLLQSYRSGNIEPSFFHRQGTFFPQLYYNTESHHNESDVHMAQRIASYLRKHLMFERNVLMAQRVNDLIYNEPDVSFFFAFGVGHFIGNQSVIDLLRNKGLKVHRISPEMEIPIETYTKKSDELNSTSGTTSSHGERCRCDQLKLFPWIVCIMDCLFSMSK